MEIINSNWKRIWEKREVTSGAIADLNNKKRVFLELKRLDGFDVVGEGLSYEALFAQYRETKDMLFKNYNSDSKKSIYEVGCGCGANLFLFENDGFVTGGLDYSNKLIDIAGEVLESTDISCCEAKDIPNDKKYDACFANSVFSYFPGEEYALHVLTLMNKKARWSLGLIDIHDIDKKEDFIAFRKKTVENYEERYKNLPKFFYSKQFFLDFAKNNDLEIIITDSNIEGYWNNDFVFNCYFYKRQRG